MEKTNNEQKESSMRDPISVWGQVLSLVGMALLHLEECHKNRKQTGQFKAKVHPKFEKILDRIEIPDAFEGRRARYETINELVDFLSSVYSSMSTDDLTEKETHSEIIETWLQNPWWWPPVSGNFTDPIPVRRIDRIEKPGVILISKIDIHEYGGPKKQQLRLLQTFMRCQ